jgi:hypothetical protein
MSFKTKRFSFEVDELSFIQLQQLIGKPQVNDRDFQKVITKIISLTHQTQKGKAVKF